MSADIPKSDSLSASEPDAGVLETTTMVLEASTVQDYDSTSDLDLANLLYVQHLPSVPDDKKAALSANVKSINSWLAWELTRAEEQVNGKIKSKQLPDDASVASKSKRTAYRSKVVDVYRGESPWLTTTTTVTQTVKVTASEGKINLAILHTLLGVGQIPKVPQVLNVVKAVGLGFDETGNMVQPHVLYIIDYQIDLVQETIPAVFKTFSFSVTVKEVTTPVKAASLRGKDVSAPKSKTYEASIDYTYTAANFNFELWNKHAPQGDASYALGKQLLPQKQLNLLQAL